MTLDKTPSRFTGDVQPIPGQPRRRDRPAEPGREEHLWLLAFFNEKTDIAVAGSCRSVPSPGNREERTAMTSTIPVLGRPEQVTAWREGRPYVAELAENLAGR